MPGRELEPFGRSGPALSEVAAEMSAVFVRAGLGESAANLRPPPTVSALRPRQRGGGTAMLLVGAAAGLIGLGAGAFVIHAPLSATPARDVRQAASRPAAPPQAAPPITVAQAAPAPAVIGPPPSQPPAAKAAPASSVQVPAQVPAKTRLAEAAPVRRRAAAPMAQPASCERDAAGAGCRRAVIQADLHLRAVYENAVRRGVPHAVLVDYRDRWADLRDRDTADPVQLIENYGALAYDLGRETRSPPADAERRRRPSGWKSVADAFRPDGRRRRSASAGWLRVSRPRS